jgi:hypothetical protein
MKTDLFRKTLRNVVEARRSPEVRIEETFDYIDTAYEWIEGMRALSDRELNDYADPYDEYLVFVAHYPAGQDSYGETNLAGYYETTLHPYELEAGRGLSDPHSRYGEPEDFYGTGDYSWEKDDINQYEGGKLIAKH